MRNRRLKSVYMLVLAVIFTFGTVACGKKSSDIENGENSNNVLSSKAEEVAIGLTGKEVASVNTTTEGAIVETYNDGTVVETKKDGTVVETKTDGTVVEFKTDNGIVLVTTTKPSGEVSTEVKKAEETTTKEPAVVQVPEITQVSTQTPTQGTTVAPTEAPTQAPTEAPTEAPTQAPTEAPIQEPTEAPTQASILSHAEAIQAFLDGFNAQRANYSMPPVTTTNSDLNAICTSWSAVMRDNGHYYHSNSFYSLDVADKLGLDTASGVEGVGVQNFFTYDKSYLEGYVEATHVKVHDKVIYGLGVDYARGNYATSPDSVYWCVEVLYQK